MTVLIYAVLYWILPIETRIVELSYLAGNMLKTAQKIKIASTLSKAIMSLRRLAGRDSQVHVKRGGIQWCLDLRQGIDFAIYLLGGFERRTLADYRRLISPGNIVIDIGANIGSHTLPLARLVGETGRVYALEPTEYAFGKLLANIQLNPEIGKRIVPRQLMLVADSSAALEPEIYSSWPLIENESLHSVHRGALKSTRGGKALALDKFLHDMDVRRVDFIKLDVDGHEPSVLQGAQQTIKNHLPVIMMELAPYLFNNTPGEFAGMIDLLTGLGYRFRSADSGEWLPQNAEQISRRIPTGASINVIVTRRHPG
jgi:FkbM family methyltransferase